ncbi:MAG TPA: tetratricopeptide repeat protein [Xanthomonadaceae bacterium]|nr:tetratricopeptide repeat protein [Xanthomonadaceae bacterium]
MLQSLVEAFGRADGEGAVAIARRAVEAAPDDPKTHHVLAMVLHAVGDREGAHASLERAMALAPGSAALQLSRAKFHYASGELEQAAQALGTTAELDPNQYETYVLQSYLALAAGDLAAAEERARVALRVQPENPRVQMALGNALLVKGEVEAAMGAYNRAVQYGPQLPAAHAVLGAAYLQQGHWAFAERAFANAIRLEPRELGARRGLIEALARQGRHAEAARYAQDLARHLPEQGALWRVLGDLQRAAGDASAATAAYRTAVERNPGDRAALGALVELARAGGELEALGHWLDQQLDAQPGHDALWRTRLVATAGPEQALAVARRWLAARPQHLAAEEAVAIALEAAGEHAAAAAAAQAIVDREPARTDAQLLLVRAQARQDPEAAYQRLRAVAEAAASVPERRAELALLADLSLRLDRPGEAVEHWLERHRLVRRPEAALLPVADPDPRVAPLLRDLPEAAADAAIPVFLYGPPGSAVERIAQLLAAQSGRRLLADRYSPQARGDRFMYPEFERYLAGEEAAIADLGRAWHAGLGTWSGQRVIDWLLHFDLRLLPAVQRALPGARWLLVLRDPRDMLLDWLAVGAPQGWPLPEPEEAAHWLAGLCRQLAPVERLLPEQCLRLDPDRLAAQPQAELARASAFLQLESDPEAGEAAALVAHALRGMAPAGRWRRFEPHLGPAFAPLAEVAHALGYRD